MIPAETGKNLPKSRLSRLICIFLMVASLLFQAASVRAQALAYAVLAPPDLTQFPLISSLFDAFDDQGNFVATLRPAEVTLLENGQELTPEKLELLPTPLNFALAVNSGPALAVRDGFGKARYDYVAAALSNWAAARPAESADTLALVWNGGIVASQLKPAAWAQRLAAFDPASRTSTSSLEALGFALDAVQSTDPGPGSKKAVLLISPHLEKADQANLNNLLLRAQQAGIRVSVWLVDSDAFQTNSGALALQDLAVSTGGQFLTFTGKETLPDPETWLASLRQVYRLTYNSKIRTGGEQTLTAQVNTSTLALTAPLVNFSLDLQPPSATLLSPPIEIVRQNPEKPFELESFTPREQKIALLVEFPDQLQRPLTRTTLFVDGEKVAENTVAPFTSFIWDLSVYTVSAEHNLRVEAEDSLGLTGVSTEVPVQVVVIQPPGGVAGLILRNRVAVTLGLVVVAGAILLGILILGGRRGLASLAERRQARAAQFDPVTQPVAALQKNEKPHPTAFPWLRRKASAPPAYFVRLTAEGAPTPGDPIPLAGQELTFGTDPTQATTILDHPSVSGLHARLHRTENGDFLLADQNSVAGTWLNYEALTGEAQRLQHGDVVNFGSLTYRFVLARPPSAPKPVILPNLDS
jgi:hypothetical protein